MYLSQSTAITIAIGPFTRVSDGALLSSLDPENDISVKIVKGATMSDLTITNSGGDNDMVGLGAFGMYSLELTTTNTDTLGLFMVLAETSDAYLVKQEYLIIDQPVFLAFQGDSNGFIASDLVRINDDDFPVTTLETLLVDYNDDQAVDTNLISVNGQTTPVDNLEDFFDDTGFNASNSTIGTLTTNSDKTGYSLTSTERNNISDALLKRDFSGITGEASRSMIKALRFLMNKWSISGATLTVYKEDDSTVSHTMTLTSDSSADPITGSDTN